MGQKERRIWMIRYLLAERGIDVQSEQCEIPAGEREQCDLPRALVNVREPEPIDETFLSVESAYLQERLREINVTDSAGISVQLIAPRLWGSVIPELRYGKATSPHCNAMRS